MRASIQSSFETRVKPPFFGTFPIDAYGNAAQIIANWCYEASTPGKPAMGESE
jgi:hypothetical protein